MQWRPPIILAILIAVSQLLAGLNSLLLAWMDYQTSLPASSFLIQTLLPIVINQPGSGGIMAVTFMAAEGLTREAFPRHSAAAACSQPGWSPH